MKEFYREMVQKCEAKLELAKIGYDVTIRQCANDLAEAKVSVAEVIIDKLNKAKDAYNEIRAELIDYQQKYEKELDKDTPAETEADNGSL